MKNTNVNFTKNMLERGMLVIARDGNRYIVMRSANGFMAFVNRNRVILFNHFRDDLTKLGFDKSDDDIVKVYGLQKVLHPFNDIFKTDTMIPMLFGGECPNRDLVWERKEVKEMTVEEISKALGYEVKIVK